jgi:hypothetical protein
MVNEVLKALAGLPKAGFAKTGDMP